MDGWLETIVKSKRFKLYNMDGQSPWMRDGKTVSVALGDNREERHGFLPCGITSCLKRIKARSAFNTLSWTRLMPPEHLYHGGARDAAQ
ncbi:hypothetical protein TNCV_1640531 [Trichonephila clavipes]|nr:hypothetical protein TNCV_1640531 [Trichonephila clavipes]